MGVSTDKATLSQLDVEFLVHPGTHLRDHARLGPFIIVEAQGIYLRDVEGRQYIDGVSCLWNVNIGHGRKEIAAAVAAQMETLDFSPIYYSMSHPPAIRLAERIAGLTPGDLNHIYFTSTGSEANESAFKIARYYWRLRGTPERYLVVSRNQRYHGTTMGALSATGLPLYRASFGPLVPGYLHLPAPYCYRCELNKEYPSCDLACARALEDLIAREGPEAVVVAAAAEPVQGTGGVIVPPPEYLPLIAKICAERGVLLIFDEIITGCAQRFWPSSEGRWSGQDSSGHDTTGAKPAGWQQRSIMPESGRRNSWTGSSWNWVTS